MGKKGSEAPPAPNPAATIAAQAAANKDAVRESAKVNAVDIYGPFGSTTYQKGPDGIPTSQTTSLNPTAQQTYQNQQDVSQGLSHVALSRMYGINMQPFSAAGQPYDPRAYDTASMPTWSSVSMARPGSPQAGQTMDTNNAGNMSYHPGYGMPYGSPAGPAPGSGSTVADFYAANPSARPVHSAPPSAPASPQPAPAQPSPAQPTAQGGQQLAGSNIWAPMVSAFTLGTVDPETGSYRGAISQPPVPLQGGSGSDTLGTSSPPGANSPTAVPGTYTSVGATGSASVPVGTQMYSGPFGTSTPPPPTGPSVPSNNPSSGDVIPYDPRSYGNMQDFSNGVGKSMFDQGMSRLAPTIEKQNMDFEQTMANRGIPMGSKAYNDAKAEMERGQNDLITSLTNQSNLSALQATQGIVGMEQGLRGTSWNESLQGAQQQQKDWMNQLAVQQNLRDKVINEDLQGRNQNINEIAAIMQGSPAIGMPQAPAPAQYNMAPVDVAGITNSAYNAQMNAYNANKANTASNWQGALGVAKAALPYVFSNSAFKIVLGDA